MSEERTEEVKDEGEDVEGHKKQALANEEPSADDESDDVEAHQRRAQQHKSN